MQWHSILMKVTDGYSFCYPITADVRPRCALYKHANGAEPGPYKSALFLQQLSVKYFCVPFASTLCLEKGSLITASGCIYNAANDFCPFVEQLFGKQCIKNAKDPSKSH